MSHRIPLPFAPRRATGLPALLLAFALAPLAVHAADEPPRHRGPPPEALQACKDKKAAAACSFTGPRGAMEGTCFAPEGKPLACRPAGAPPPRDGGGPDGERPEGGPPGAR